MRGNQLQARIIILRLEGEIWILIQSVLPTQPLRKMARIGFWKHMEITALNHQISSIPISADIFLINSNHTIVSNKLDPILISFKIMCKGIQILLLLIKTIVVQLLFVVMLHYRRPILGGRVLYARQLSKIFPGLQMMLLTERSR